MSLVTKVRWGLDIAGGLQVSNLLAEVITISQGYMSPIHDGGTGIPVSYLPYLVE